MGEWLLLRGRGLPLGVPVLDLLLQRAPALVDLELLAKSQSFLLELPGRSCQPVEPGLELVGPFGELRRAHLEVEDVPVDLPELDGDPVVRVIERLVVRAKGLERHLELLDLLLGWGESHRLLGGGCLLGLAAREGAGQHEQGAQQEAGHGHGSSPNVV